MIKSLIILALLLLLVAGAFLSRPSPQSLKPYSSRKRLRPLRAAGARGLIQGLLSDAQIDAFMKSCTFKDRLLWVDVESRWAEGVHLLARPLVAAGEFGRGAAAPAGHSSKS